MHTLNVETDKKPTRSQTRRRAVGLVTGLCLAASIGLAQPAEARTPNATVEFRLVSVQVHDDGDNVGCGDFAVSGFAIGGNPETPPYQAPWVRVGVDNGTEWAYGGLNTLSPGSGFQDYCSDTTYQMPTNIAGKNRQSKHAPVGDTINIRSDFSEYDVADSHVSAHNITSIKVPQKGSSTTKKVQVESSAGSDHFRLTLTYRVSSS